MDSVAVIDDEGQVQNIRIQVVQLPSGEVALESLGPEFCQIIATPQLADVLEESDKIITQLPRKPPDCKIRLQIADDVDALAEPTDDGQVKCKLCNYTTDKKANWYKHRKCHLGLRPYKCDFCNYHATNTSNLKRHLQMHTDARRFVCQLCRTKFRQKVHLDRHILVKHGERSVQCSLCDFTCFSVDPDLKRHLAKNHLVGDGTFVVRIYVCAECNYETKDRREMNQHRKLHRNPEPKMFCELCNYVTDLESRFCRHMMKHSGEKPFACQLCPYRGGQKEHLHLHMRKHHGAPARKRGRPRKCPLPDDGGAGDAAVAMDDNAGLVSTAPDDQVLNGDDLDAVDSTGGSSFTTIAATAVRSRSGPSNVSLAPGLAASQKLYPCTHCSMRFSKPLALFKHVRVQHEGASYANHDGQSELACVLCEFKTTDKKLLLAHLRKHSLAPKSSRRKRQRFQCEHCTFTTGLFGAYSAHLKDLHGIDAATKDDQLSSSVDEQAEDSLSWENGGDEVEGHADDSVKMETVAKPLLENEELGEVMEGQVDDGTQELGDDAILSTDDLRYAILTRGGLLTSLQSHSAATPVSQTSRRVAVARLDNELNTSSYEEAQPHAADDDNAADHHGDVVESTVDSMLTDGDLGELTTGDFIEINGQMYKIEVAPHLEDHW